MEQLIVRLKIEENKPNNDRRSFNPTVVKANIVEHRQSFKNWKGKKKLKLAPRGGVLRLKFLGKCFNYGHKGHKSNECKLPNMKNKNVQTNMIDYIA